MSNRNQTQSIAVPEDPLILDILSVTFGGKDFTNFVRANYAAFLSQNPEATTFTFPVTNTYFNGDPNQNVFKCGVAIWRNTIVSDDGEVVWSDFKRYSSLEGGNIVILYDGVNDKPWVAPAPPSTGQFIASAFWFGNDVTTTAQAIAASQPLNQYGTSFNVSAASLGPDPRSDITAKNFSIVYGTWVYPGAWTFSTAVGTGPNTGWTLTLPVLFPPLQPPSEYGSYSYTTFKNSSTGIDMYPQFYGTDMSLAWDGRAQNLLITNNTSLDVELVGTAGLKERQGYYPAFCTTDGAVVYGSAQLYVIASSSAMAHGIGSLCTYTNNTDGTFKDYVVVYDFLNYNNPLQYQKSDLRLNIYSATWGSGDYTDFVRQMYISSTLSTPPTNGLNRWSFTPSLTYFGPDPSRNIFKAFVVIYRLAYKVGTTSGVIFDPNDPMPWDPLYTQNNVQPVHTDQYPVLRDISGFQIATAQEDSPLLIDLLTASLTPMPPDADGNPLYRFVAGAAWGTKDVTVQSGSANGINWPGGPPPADQMLTISVGTSTMGSQPLASSAPNYTILLGYASPNVRYPPLAKVRASMKYRTYVAVLGTNPCPVYVGGSIPNSLISWPTSYVSDVAGEVMFSSVQMMNTAPFDVWPTVVNGTGQIQWDGKAASIDQWRIPTHGTINFNLLGDANCTEGVAYAVNFNCSQYTYPPLSGWYIATGSSSYSLSLMYQADPSVRGKYQILRTVIKSS